MFSITLNYHNYVKWLTETFFYDTANIDDTITKILPRYSFNCVYDNKRHAFYSYKLNNGQLIKNL